jgi:hypothetical protein
VSVRTPDNEAVAVVSVKIVAEFQLTTNPYGITLNRAWTEWTAETDAAAQFVL